MNHWLLAYATRLRNYLVLLQLMFVVLYGYHLKLPLAGFDAAILLFLAVCTLLVLTVPAPQRVGVTHSLIVVRHISVFKQNWHLPS